MITTVKQQLATLHEQIQVAYTSDIYPQAEQLLREYLDILENDNTLSLKAEYYEHYRNALHTISIVLWRQGRATESMPYAQKACVIAEDNGEIWITGRMNLGIVHAHLGEFQQAESNFLFVVNHERAQEIPDFVQIFSAYLGLGNIHSSQVNYTTALEYYHKALEIAEKQLGAGEVAKALGGISILYKDMEMYDISLKYTLQVLEIEKKRHNISDLARTQSNIGLLYHAIGEYNLALEHLSAALEGNTSLGRLRGMSINLMNIGVVYLAVGGFDEARQYMEKALVIDEEIGNKKGVAQALSGLGKIYSMPENPLYDITTAEKYYLRSLALEQEHNSLEFSIEIRTMLADLYKSTEQWKEYSHFIVEKYEIEKKVQVEQARKTAEKYAYERQIEIIEREKEILRKHNAEMEEKNNVITKQKQQLEETLFELHEITNIKDLMMGTIVHDFKNPLNTILQAVNSKIIGDIENRRRGIEVAARRMLQLTMNILDIQQLETAQLHIQARNFETKKAVNTAIDEVLPFAYEKNIRIVVEDADLQGICHGDLHLVERILVNLLSNALKYTSIGGIVYICGFRQNKEKFCFVVRDSGKGIAADLQERIFARFTKGNDVSDMGYVKSTGLGLTFCKLAVEAHGGTIWFESEKGKGSSFYFTVPLVEYTVLESPEHHVQEYRLPIIQLSEEEKLSVQKVATSIHEQGIKMYEYSALMAILDNTLLHSEGLQQWRHSLEMAALEGDYEAFNKLLYE